MHLVRYRAGVALHQGLWAGDHVRPLWGDPFGAFELGEVPIPIGDVTLVAPIQPRQILAVGLNYRSHLLGREAPDKPELFWKPPSAIVGPHDPILLPPDSVDVHAEGELVIVIGKTAKNLTPDTAMEAVYGFTIGNDVSERTWQQHDRQWWRAKGADSFAPIGPAIVTDFDWRQATLETRIDDVLVQEGNLSDLLFDVPTVVAFASAYVTLVPGDLIFTGTPGQTKTLVPGNHVSVSISGLGTLTNPVQAAR